jgi:hypothetical protein
MELSEPCSTSVQPVHTPRCLVDVSRRLPSTPKLRTNCLPICNVTVKYGMWIIQVSVRVHIFRSLTHVGKGTVENHRQDRKMLAVKGSQLPHSNSVREKLRSATLFRSRYSALNNRCSELVCLLPLPFPLLFFPLSLDLSG